MVELVHIHVFVVGAKIATVALDDCEHQTRKGTWWDQLKDETYDAFPKVDGFEDKHAGEVRESPEGKGCFDEVGNEAVYEEVYRHYQMVDFASGGLRNRHQ